MKMCHKIIAMIIVLLSIFTILAPIKVYAEETTMIIFKAEVDPRIKAKGQAVLIGFTDEDGKEYNVYLRKESGYEYKMNLPQGYYTIFSGMVMGDLAFEYDVHYDHFTAIGLTQEVIITAGDVNYSGKVEEDNNTLVGDIDRDKTNELLKEDGLPTIDWEKLDAAHDPNAPWDPDNPYMGHADKPENLRDGEPWNPEWGENPDPEKHPDDPDYFGNTGTTPGDTQEGNNTGDNTGNNNENNDNENLNNDYVQTPGGLVEGDEKGSKGFSILFIIVILALCSIPLIIRIKGHGDSDD